MTLTEHEAAELERCGRAIIARGDFSAGALLGHKAGDNLSTEVYDSLMSKYRTWLVFSY